jgi:hypothetical protein
MPGWEVGGFEIFLLGRDVLAMTDGLGISPNSVAAAKTLKPCIGVSHVKGDLEETHHCPLPGVPNVEGFHVARTWGTTRRTQRYERSWLYA